LPARSEAPTPKAPDPRASRPESARPDGAQPVRPAEHRRYRRAAEEGLAATVHGPGPATQAVESGRRKVARERVADLALRDQLAVTRDLPVGRVGGNPFRILVGA